MSTTLSTTALPLIDHWIDGRALTHDGDRLEVLDPATGDAVGSVALADEALVERAVHSSAVAFEQWGSAPLSRRMQILRRFRNLLAEEAGTLAEVIATEHGKMVDDAAGEVARGLEVVDLACAAPTMLQGRYSDQVAGGIDTYSMRLPVGVCVGITPFNFPAMVPLWMFPIALACGNSFVLKPSEQDPSASLMLARLLDEAGLPPGVFNVVQGNHVAAQSLIAHPAVKAVSFVGSTTIARQVYVQGATGGKRVQALGGAKNHLVVLPDADIDQAADAAVSAAFGSAGQRCMAVSVVVAVEPCADALAAAITSRTQQLRVGPASESDSQMGPVINTRARDRIVTYVERGVADGAVALIDGRELAAEVQAGGTFVGPTVLDHVRPGMGVYDDEVFGPLLVIVRAGDLGEAIGLIAASGYGNGAAIFTQNGGDARRFAREAAAGMVGVNVPIPVPVGFYSFGGWGDSLFGDTHVYGPEGFNFYTRGKVVTSRWPEQSSGVNLAFPGSR
jgi:malonate-semialdehyde dehydrogenase (acetylating) / methylmalonate-semialdehyde dehydrogenase